MNVAILASHEGTTLQAVLDACARGVISGRPVVVVSNNRDSGALRRARAAGVPACHLSSVTHPDPNALDAAICQTLIEHGAEIVVCAGYMKKLGPRTLARFRGRIVNTHPSLLPKFGGAGMYGLRVHQAVLAAGERKTGASVHVVDEDYDTGPVIAQCEVAVETGDTPEALAARVQAEERVLLVSVLRRIAEGTLRLPAP